MKNKKKQQKKTVNNNENNSCNYEKSKLYNSLNTINISISGVFLVLYGVLINIEYLLWQRDVILDDINNTNFTKNMEDLSESPKKSNLLYLISTVIFVGVIWNEYNNVKNDKNSTDIDIEKQYKSLSAILLFLLGTSLNYDVLNNNRYKK